MSNDGLTACCREKRRSRRLASAVSTVALLHILLLFVFMNELPGRGLVVLPWTLALGFVSMLLVSRLKKRRQWPVDRLSWLLLCLFALLGLPLSPFVLLALEFGRERLSAA